MSDTTTLWRPVGPEELQRVRELGMRAFPPRLPDQPIFYPVLSKEYAVKIARDWNVARSGSGFVTKFEVRNDYLSGYAIQKAGGNAHQEYWIPAEDLSRFNEAIVGVIEITESFP
ncbi:ADP-ribosylation/crystallin J1 [Rhizobium sp.]